MGLQLRRELDDVPAALAEDRPLPSGYGAAWIDYTRNVLVCYPVPLNVLAGWLRRGWRELVWGAGTLELTWMDAECAAAYDSGFEKGVHVGEAVGERRGQERGYQDGLIDRRRRR